MWVVPESTPVEVLSVMPLGSAPLSLQVIVPIPPDCVNVWLNATPAVPLFTPGLVTEMTGQVMVSVYDGFVPVQPLPSVTVTTIGNEPPCIGVPVRTPAVVSVTPVGSVDAVVNVAPPTAPLCVKVKLAATSAVPAASLFDDGLLTVMTGS